MGKSQMTPVDSIWVLEGLQCEQKQSRSQNLCALPESFLFSLLTPPPTANMGYSLRDKPRQGLISS